MRNFNVNNYVRLKTDVINDFFRKSHLDSVVVGISGGVDSAVALMLYVEAALEQNSPLKQIRAIMMPIYGNGVTGQKEATIRALQLVDHVNTKVEEYSNLFTYHLLDLTEAYEGMVKSALVDSGGLKTTPWTDGQMASVLRTPMFYYQAAILQQEGYRSVISGTTNRDEGSYIGFFGKASDGMVDVQPIADIHKSEVYKLAHYFNIPESIINEKPKGDVWDERVDEEMIGAPYWFLQEYLEAKCSGARKLYYFTSNESLNPLHYQYMENIENLHRTNAHKYQVGSPAHFLDVLERKVPGGWE